GVAATAWFGGRLLGALGGFVAGMALLTSVGFFAFARYVRPETLFVAALAWGFALVLTGVAEGRRGRVAAGLAVFGVAGLAKDPIGALAPPLIIGDRKSTRLNSSHVSISYAVFCLKKKKTRTIIDLPYPYRYPLSRTLLFTVSCVPTHKAAPAQSTHADSTCVCTEDLGVRNEYKHL